VEDIEAAGLGLSFTVTDVVDVQPLASVTVTEYVPASTPVVELAVPPEGCH
jgi:hypothetical protein